MSHCEVCEPALKNKSKYKCPSCFIKYCSLDCWKIHRTGDCSKKEESTELKMQIDSEPPKDVLFPTNDTINLEVLSKLQESKELKDLLRNPALRDVIKEVDSARNVRRTIQAAMTEPIFTEFADVCLKIVEPPQTNTRETL